MNVNGTPSNRDLARLQYEQTRQEALSESRERVRGARDELQRLSDLRAARLRRGRETTSDASVRAARETAASNADSVQISDRARILASDHEVARPHRDNEARAERVAELKGRFERGELNTRANVERAAEQLLRGDA